MYLELSEINLVDHYDAKVLGLYKGSTALNEHWSHDWAE
jgi:hypothetical protein